MDATNRAFVKAYGFDPDKVETAIRESARQTRLESALESSINIATGFVISYLVWLFIVPVLFGQHVSSTDPHVAFWLTCVFTVSSWLRSYVWRRFFNASVHRRIHRWIFRK